MHLILCPKEIYELHINSKQVNAQVFEIASKLEETPLLGSPTHKAPTDPLPPSPTLEDDSLEGAKPYTDDDINEVGFVMHL